MEINELSWPFSFEVVYEDYDQTTVAWSLNNGPVHIQIVPSSDEVD